MVLRSAIRFVALIVVILSVATVSTAVERTAYIVDAYGNMNSGVLPTSSGPMQLSTIADFDNHLVGSTMDSDGSLLALLSETDELVRIDLATLEYQVLHTLAVDIVEFDDLTFGPSGELLLLHGGWALSGSSSLFHIDTETGGLTMLAEFDEDFITIEYHQGAYYAGNYPYQFWRIDPETFETTLIQDYFNGFGGRWIWGLASIGDSLWCGYTIPAGYLLFLPTIGVIDPETGDLTDHAWLGLIADNYPFHQSLEIVEQIVPIPALGPTGIIALVMALGLFGTLAIRRL